MTAFPDVASDAPSSTTPSSTTPERPVTIAAIRAAAVRMAGVTVRTPLLSSPALDRRLGLSLLVKAETLQRTGSFKFRGAYNALVRLTPEQRARGVVAYSSGNHAQGVAAAAEALGIRALIVMPADAPALKIANTRGYGAEVVFYDRFTQDRVEMAGAVAAERGASIIPPYEHADVMAGQGTAGLEMAEQAAEQGARIDAVVVCHGGGGLTAGIATAFEALSPSTRLFSAEPAEFDDMRRSLLAGERLANPPGRRSICDAIMTEMPGALTFAVNSQLLEAGLVANDAQVEHAMAVAFDMFKLVIEPGGAAALAAVLAEPERFAGQTVAVTASGGNVDRAQFAGMLSRNPL